MADAFSIDWQLNKSVLESNQYMLDNQFFCDVTFTFQNDKSAETNSNISAHKYVLVSRSPVFCAMFTGPAKHDSSIVKIEDIKKAVFTEMLRYIYFEKVYIGPENVLEVLYCAKKYMIPGLEKHCRDILQKNLSPWNVCTILEGATALDESALEDECLDMIDESSAEVLESDSFTNINKETVERIVERDTLDIEEIQLYHACVRWADCECTRSELEPTSENRRKVLDTVLFKIRFPVMDPNSLITCVMKEKILTSDECVDLALYMKDCSPHSSLPFSKEERKPVWTEIISDWDNCWQNIDFSKTNVTFTVQNVDERLLELNSILLIKWQNTFLQSVELAGRQTDVIITQGMYGYVLDEAKFTPTITLGSGEHSISLKLKDKQLETERGSHKYLFPKHKTSNFANSKFTISVNTISPIVGFICRSKSTSTK